MDKAFYSINKVKKTSYTNKMLKRTQKQRHEVSSHEQGTNRTCSEAQKSTLINKKHTKNDVDCVRKCVVRLKRARILANNDNFKTKVSNTKLAGHKDKENLIDQCTSKERNGENCNHSENLALSNRKCTVRIKPYSKEQEVIKLQNKKGRVRKCVVRVQRLKFQSKNEAREVESSNKINESLDNFIAFEPERNSTICLSTEPSVTCITPRHGRRQRTEKAQKDALEKQMDTSKKRHEIVEKEQNSPVQAKAGRFFHRDQPTRTRSSVTRHVYEFLSQSDIQDSNESDPASDIIKKMIADGRACAMIRLKSGKTRKRPVARKVRPVGKRKLCSVRDITEKKPTVDNDPEQLALSPICEGQDNSSIHDGNNPRAAEVPIQVHVPSPHLSAKPNNKANVESTYSPLARSLLLNQTNSHQSEQTVDRRRELFNMARNFVSTPLNRKSVSNSTKDINNVTLSPVLTSSGSRHIPAPNGVTSPSRLSSPWRVPDEAPLPNTFVFGLNNSQLPSYSSDFVSRRHIYVPDESICPTTTEQDANNTINDSNGENVPPPTVQERLTESQPTTPIKPSDGQENENIQNLVQRPNPRQGLQHRSPLKDINILEVLVLPPWDKIVQLNKTPNKQPLIENKDTAVVDGQQQQHQQPEEQEPLDPQQHEQEVQQLQQQEQRKELLVPQQHENEEQQLQQQEQRQEPQDTQRLEGQEEKEQQKHHELQGPQPQEQSVDLFGFEELLSPEDEEHVNMPETCQNMTLHEKLQRLKNLLPAQDELPQVSREPLRYDYDNLEAKNPKQRNIKDMLCSTMIAKPTTRVPSPDESLALFKDIDPETTFDEKKPRRTYVRERPKRKRKKRVHVLFIETDSSSDEEKEVGLKDTSVESPEKGHQAHKRKRVDRQHEAKLQEYVKSFNQECAEVEKFPLIIE